MTETVLSAELLAELQPAHVSPIVTYLASHTNNTSGSCFEVGGGWFSKVRIQRSACVSLAQGQKQTSAEEIGNRLADITRFDDDTVSYPSGPGDALQAILKARGSILIISYSLFSLFTVIANHIYRCKYSTFY
jgi:(3R)-3-hydroxyacyl-CoA dehydrogenase / 3a,7a,12a-trihydroxy-5b-cholest-24-enoyl-CoA hydratase / enoyl-CoA hydratase 2